ncbi:alpha/beta hydrolase-fold protein [Marinifilum fragile]|uniref:alpha/beta hydrolase-fold protein n=1 Tax=Marinifilum fragile TaxID=570161 RepID=UPI002AABA294|nr:alpha/beta hydrolase-fold protein [Marinifilum fragile]
MTRIIIISIIVLLSLAKSFGQNQEPITIGQKYTIESEILNESREYWVYLPSDYGNSKYDYPVMYLLDGQEHFHQITGVVNHMSRLVPRMPRMIIVGIVSTDNDRLRDYTPNQIEILPNGGGADQFTIFLKNELISKIENDFRTNDYRLLFGHSLAAVCLNHIFTNQNELFNVYFAADPAIFVDPTIAKDLESYISKQDTVKSNYFLSVCGLVDSTTIVPNVKLSKRIESKYSDKINWDFKFYSNEDHISMTLKAMYDALEKLYSDYKIPGTYIHSFDKESILNHIKKNEDRYKIHIALPEQLVNEYAMHFCTKQKYDDALDLLQLNLENYKAPYETYYFIGQVYSMKGDKSKALQSYEKSYGIKEIWDVKDKIEKIKNE